MEKTPSLTAAIESLLGNASLTADLDDEAADELLSWGISCVRKIYLEAAERQDQDQFIYQRMRAVRKMMRAVNNWASMQGQGDPESRAASFHKVLKRITGVYGSGPLSPIEAQRAEFNQQPAIPIKKRIASLRRICEGDTPEL